MVILANGESRVGMPLAAKVLLQGGSALDAVECAIRAVEADPTIHSVGLGGRPNLAGEVECDAAIMDGCTLQAGAVGALRGYLHAISIAREVMERTPHTLLAGEGARLFAEEVGAQPADMLTDEAAAEHRRWLRGHVPQRSLEKWPDVPMVEHAWESGRTLQERGTSVVLVMDGTGAMAGGASSSGWAGKYPGRVGDSAVVGAGLHTDARYGGCACTHTGEMTIRAATARSVVLYMKQGASVEIACEQAANDLRRLSGGFLGPVIIHAIDTRGTPHVLATGEAGPDIRYCYWDGTSDTSETGCPARTD
jgi:L-asparaginase